MSEPADECVRRCLFVEMFRNLDRAVTVIHIRRSDILST